MSTHARLGLRAASVTGRVADEVPLGGRHRAVLVGAHHLVPSVRSKRSSFVGTGWEREVGRRKGWGVLRCDGWPQRLSKIQDQESRSTGCHM